jgi:SAM-dependent methyltransferase
MKLMNGLRTIKSEKENGNTFAERLLLFFSKEPGTDDYEEGKDKWNLDTALSLLCRVYQNFMSSIVGKQILDFGCGMGYQTVALARNGARYVLGIDTNAKRLNEARDLAGRLGLQQQVEFAARLEDRFRGRFDMVISQNSFEHFSNPIMALKEMKSALNPGGQILITFGPPWYSPYGSHMHFFTKVPYVNIIFREKTVMNVRAHFRTDGATKYEEVESGLNKMTVAKFEQVVANAGLSIQYRKYECAKRLDFLAWLPFLREIFINHISCIVTR